MGRVSAWVLLLSCVLGVTGGVRTSLAIPPSHSNDVHSPRAGIRFPEGRDTFQKNFRYLLALAVQAAVDTETDATHGQISLRRHLAIGDFAALNNILVGATIQLPDVSASEGNLDIDLKNPYCQQIEIGDVLLSYNQESIQQYTFTVQIVSLALKCYSDYDYGWRFVDGGGEVYADVSDSSATTVLSFTSPNFNTSPPTASNVDSCVANVNIDDLDFDGGIVNSILNAFEQLFRGTIAGAVEGVICDELSSLGTTFVGDLLDWAETEINAYLQPIPPNLSNPLYPEDTMNTPPGKSLLNFQNLEESWGPWVADILGQVAAFLGEEANDPTAPDGSGRDLGVNTFLRQSILAADRSLSLTIADLPFQAFDPVLFQSHDLLTETTITLISVKIFGLDTFSRFDPLVAIGKYTLQNVLQLDFITVELDLEVRIRPSTNEDSIIDVPNPNVGITEMVQVSFGIDNLSADIALLLAIDEFRLKALEIGALLRTDNLLSCFATVIHKLALAGFDVSIGSIRDPVLSGFLSPGIDRVVSNAVEFVFLMYEPTFLQALPSMFQGPFRDIIQEEILESSIFNPTEGSCTWLEDNVSLDQFIDFRDLFLPPLEAGLIGASGTEPYGNLGHMIFGVFQDRIVGGGDGSGSVALNDALVNPITTAQSGTSGELFFEGSFISIAIDSLGDNEFATMISGLNFSAGDTRITNLASLVPPISLMEPTMKPRALWNTLRFSDGIPETVDMNITLRLNIDGNESPWTMNDEVIFRASFDGVVLSGELQALVETSKFLRLPLKHVFDLDCWLSMIPPPEVDLSGEFIVDDTLQLGLISLSPVLKGFSLGATCVTCSNGLAYLPSLLFIFQSAGAMDLLGSRLGFLAKSIFLGRNPVQVLVDRMLFEASYACPVSPRYDEDRIVPQYPPLGFPDLSATDVDTLLFATMLFGQVGLVAISENHRMYSYVPIDPLQLQETVSPGSNYLDWTAFGTSLGLGGIGDQIFDEALSFLEGRDSIGNLRINTLVKDNLLDSDGAFSLSFQDVSVEVDQMALSLDEVRITGLDNFQSIKLLDPLGPQTLSNEFAIGSLGIEITASVDILSTADPPQEVTFSFGVSDLSFSVILFATIDVDKVGGLELGSIVNTGDLLSCILSTFDQLIVPRISINSADLQKPSVSGLFADSSSVLSSTIDRVWEQFQLTIDEALPILFDTSIRKIINSVVDNILTDAICPERDSATGFVDFRDLFAGLLPYGTLPQLAMDLVRSELFSLDVTTGFAKLNDLVRSWTTETYGTDGLIGTDEYLFDKWTRRFRRIGIDRLRFAFGKTRVENIDTIKAPITLLEPDPSNGTLLNNYIGLGGEPNPIRFSAEVVLESQGDSALTSKNDMEFAVEIANVDIFASILARIDLDDFMSFQLRQLLDLNCWFALFYRDDAARDLMLETLSITVSSFQMHVTCLLENSCSSGLSEADLFLKNITQSEEGEVLVRLVLDAVQEILESDYVHSLLDQWIADAAVSCPDISSDFPLVRRTATSPSAQLSMDAMQKLAAVVVFGLEAGAVGIFESHASMSTEWDPLAAQDALTINDTELIDFTNFTTSMGDWANTLVNELRSYAEGGEDGPRINELLRSFFLDDEGVMAFNLSHVRIDSPEFTLALVEIRLRYLDSFSDVELLDMIAPQTIRNVIKMNRIRGELDLTIEIGGQSLPLTVHMELEDVRGAFSILLAVNKGVLGDIELGQLLFRENLLRCFFSAMPQVHVTELDFSAANIASFGVDGVGGSSVFLESITAYVLDLYGERMAQLMQPFFGTTIRAILNNWFEDMVSKRYETGCPLSLLNATNGAYVDLRDLMMTDSEAKAFGASGASPYGDLFQWALDIVKDNLLDIDEKTGLSDANKALIAPLTRAQSGEAGKVSFPGDILSTDTRVQVGGLDALVNFRLYDVFIRNLDTVGAPLSVLDIVRGKPTEVSNRATFGKSEPVQVGFEVYLFVSDENSEVRNNVSIAVDLTSVPVIVDAVLALLEERFISIPVRHLTDFSCWLWMIPAPILDSRGIRDDGAEVHLGLTKLDAAIGRVGMNVTCKDCTSPGMQDFSELLSTEEAADSATEVANMLVDYMEDLLGGDYLQTWFDKLLNDAERQCPVSPLYDANYISPEYVAFESPVQSSDSLQTLLLIAISTGIVIAALLLVMTCVKCVVRRRHRRWIRTLPGRKVQALLQLQTQEKTKEEAVNDLTRSLFRSTHVPLYLRWGMPVIILGNVAFFLSGHLSLGATVNIEAHFAEQEFSVKNFFEFSMLRSTIEIWNAGGKELAVMIFIFSVIWPYTKQLITLVVWFAPPRLIGISRRGSTLLWLDTLAKWSMVDIMTLIVTVAGFRLSIQSPDVGFLPKDFYSLDLLVVPMWGLYANMIAQLISQLSSHTIIHYHRRVEEAGVKEFEELYRLRMAGTVVLEDHHDDTSTIPSAVEPNEDEANQGSENHVECLSQHAFLRPHRGEADQLIVRRGTGSMAVFAAVSVVTLVLVGCVLPSFSLEFLGILGVAIESGQEFQEARTEYTVFTIINLLFEQANFTGRVADYFGLGSLAAILILSVLIVPIVQSVVLLYMWFKPMCGKRRRRLAIGVEILQAWQYAEVYLMSVIVASWQLGPVSDFMINTYCENLKETFAQMVYYGILKEEDAQCFRVEARIENASYILAAASVALALLNTFVMRAVSQYFRDIDLTKREYKATPGRAGEEVEDVTVAIQRVTPVPVLFSDAFRWMLVREDLDPSRRVFIANARHTTDMISEEEEGELGLEEEEVLEDEIKYHPQHPGIEPMKVTRLEPSPLEAPAFDEIPIDESETYYYEDVYQEPAYFTFQPTPRQPEVLSNEAVRDTRSARTSLEEGGERETVLSAVSELTEPTDPWRDY